MSTSFEPFIGVGTGRCGSHTLVKILGACKKVACVHEFVQIPWYDGGGDPVLGKLIRRFKDHKEEGIMSGEVGPCLIRHISSLRSAFPGLKVICLHRSKDETVNSYLNYGKSMPPLRPLERYKWADGCMGPERMDAGVVKCFPVIDAASRAQSISFWWEMYEAMMAEIAQPVHHIHVKALNIPEQVGGIFDFLAIPIDNRVYIPVKAYWSMEEVKEVGRKLRMRDRYA